MLMWYDRGMTMKIGVSLPDDLYEWAVREVDKGRAESVSGLIAHGLKVLRSQAELKALVEDMRAEFGEPDEETKAWAAAAFKAAEEAQWRHLTKRSREVLWALSFSIPERSSPWNEDRNVCSPSSNT